jgi:light-regulated signal transduction histidine kinase (bacteriophytochrome)
MVALGGNRAGIDDVYVGIIFEINYLIPGVEKIRKQGIGLKLIQSASQGLKGYLPFHGRTDEG